MNTKLITDICCLHIDNQFKIFNIMKSMKQIKEVFGCKKKSEQSLIPDKQSNKDRVKRMRLIKSPQCESRGKIKFFSKRIVSMK